MKALIIGDCHGEMPDIPGEGFDLVLCVGDICGGTDEMRTAMFQAIDSEKTWYEIFGEEEAREAVEESIEEGKEILSRLEDLGVPVLVVPGNWDWTGENSEWDFLEGKGYPEVLKGFENVQDLNFSSREFEEFVFIGYGPCSGPEIPQYEDDKPDSEETMEEIREEYLEKKEKLSDIFRTHRDSGKTVFLSHNVPQETSLDRIDNPDNPRHGRHYGSVIVKEIIEEFSPEFSIAGHIHEGEGRETLGESLCLNTGLNTVWVLDKEEGISKYS
jgi:Icc-related predicted phosphoesterase